MSNATILLLEDDEMIQEITAVILREVGYTTLCASTAEIALDRIRTGEWQPDLLILDILLMDGVGGVNFVRQMEQEGLRTMPIALFTCSGKIEHYAEQLQVEETLCKPFEIERFLGKIERLLQKEQHSEYSSR